MAAHYGIAVLPTRPRRPRDKGKIEACALIVERWLIGACATDDSTASPSSTRDWRAAQAAQRGATDPTAWVTRRQLLEELDRPVLKPLPTQPYVVAEWRVRRVGIHYHVDVEGRIYSVPIAARAARSKCAHQPHRGDFVKGERNAMHMRALCPIMARNPGAMSFDLLSPGILAPPPQALLRLAASPMTRSIPSGARCS